MWTKHPARQLARARLDIPGTSDQPHEGGGLTLDASVRSYGDGALFVALRMEPGGHVCTLPLLAWLQFIGRCEDAAIEALASMPGDHLAADTHAPVESLRVVRTGR